MNKEQEVTTETSTEVTSTQGITEKSETPVVVTQEKTENAPAQELETYTPPAKFKVEDKEYDFDDFIKPVITKDTEAKIRDLYTKAHGLDIVKKKAEEYKTNYKKYEDGFKNLQSMVQNEEYDKFLQTWGVDNEKLLKKMPKEAVLQMAADLLRYEELTPEQRAEVDKQQQLQEQFARQQNELGYLKQQFQHQLVTQRQSELESELSRADVVKIAKEFDARAGRQGAFKDECIMRGRAKYMLSGQKYDPSAKEVVNEVMQFLGYEEVEEQAESAQQIVAPATQKKLPVIPNIGGGRSSPVAKQITSLEDLKKIRRSMQQQ